MNEFLQLNTDKQRNILGEMLFPMVSKRIGGDLAPKITGMLIDLTVLEVGEIIEFLEDESILDVRIEEAKNLIESELSD